MHVDAWNSSMLPMYKASTQKNHQHNVVKHLMPQFGIRSCPPLLDRISRRTSRISKPWGMRPGRSITFTTP